MRVHVGPLPEHCQTTAHTAAAVDCDRAEVREQKTSELYCQHISIFRSHNAQLEGTARRRHGFLGDP